MGCFWLGLYLFGPSPLEFLLYTSPPLSLSSVLTPNSSLQLLSLLLVHLLSCWASSLPSSSNPSSQLLLPPPSSLLSASSSLFPTALYTYMICSPAICWMIIWTISSIRGRLIVLIGTGPIRNDKLIRKHCVLFYYFLCDSNIHFLTNYKVHFQAFSCELRIQ